MWLVSGEWRGERLALFVCWQCDQVMLVYVRELEKCVVIGRFRL